MQIGLNTPSDLGLLCMQIIPYGKKRLAGKIKKKKKKKTLAWNQDAVGTKNPDLRTDTSVTFLSYETYSVYSNHSHKSLLSGSRGCCKDCFGPQFEGKIG